MQLNSETNHPKVFKVDIGNDRPWDILQVVWLWVERSKVKVRVRLGLTLMSAA